MDEQFTVVLEPGDQGPWIATIPEFPGAVSQGATEAEAKEMVLDCMRDLMAFRRECAVEHAAPGSKIEPLRLTA